MNYKILELYWRIDKAIEYIEEECYGFNLVDDIQRDEAFKKIIKILKGEGD